MNKLELVGLTKEDTSIISKFWAEGLQYKGRDLFNDYMEFLGWLEDEQEENCHLLKSDRWTEMVSDEDGDEDDCGEYPEEITRELQESYMGYIPSIDTFITGFDMWEGDDNPAGVALWKTKDGKFELVSEDIDYCSSMMYGKFGAYHKLHKKYDDLIDIRLD